MQVFSYTAKDAGGKLIKAQVEATSVAEAGKLLKSKDLFALSIEPYKKGSGQRSLELFNRITSKDKVVFTRQLATLVKAGLPLAKALRVLTEQIENQKLVQITRSVSTSVEGGTSLSQSLAPYPNVFSPIFINMVEAGEASGNLDETLLKLSEQEEKTHAINTKIRSAFTYPAVVLAVLIAVMILMITIVLPQVGKMYADLGRPLPLMTEILLWISRVFTRFWFIWLALIGGGVYASRAYLLTPAGRASVDRLKLRLPVFSPLINKMYMARFARTLGSLVSSGVPVLQGLAVTSKSMNNVHLEKAVKEATEKVKAGAPLSQAVNESPLFLPLTGQMMAVGEETGTIGESLSRVASYYEEEVDEAVRNISQLIEPATMILLGVMVAFLIAAVLLPIYGLVSNIR